MHDGFSGLRHHRSGRDRLTAQDHILNAIPEDVRPRIHTRRGVAIHSVRAGGSQTFQSSLHCFAVMLAPSPGIQAAFEGEKPEILDATAGTVVVSPANVQSRLHWPHRRENIVVAFEPESLRELALSESGAGDIQLTPVKGVVDLQALQLAQLLKTELTRDGQPNELYVDSLVTLFGLHVLRRYSSAGGTTMHARAGLSAEAAKRVTEYLDECFTNKISVAELAAICNLSPGYFIHSFTRTFGMPPHRYLLNRRLALAEKLLVESDIQIAEVAVLSGFSSQSHLTTSMRKHRGATPGAVRAQR